MLVFFRILFFILLSLTASAQLSLKISCNDDPKALRRFKWKTNYSNEEDVKKEITQIISQIQSLGYLTVSVDSIIITKQEALTYLSVGKRYSWTELKIEKKDLLIFADAGLNTENYQKVFFSHKELKKIHSRLLTYLENNWFPFAIVKFDSLDIQANSIGAKLIIQKNKFVTLDSIKQEPSLFVSKNFISHYLQIKEGMPYSEKKNADISRKLKQLPFLKQSKPPLIKLTDKTTKLYLFLDKVLKK